MEHRAPYNAGFDMDAFIAALPPSLERTVLTTLEKCVGRDQALSRRRLLDCVRRVPGLEDTHERAVRYIINQARKNGAPICSTGGDDGGYWLAASWDELNEYLDRELRSRLKDLREQEQAMTRAAEQRWGLATVLQGRMF
jgi:hypothetical protein